MEKNSSGAKDSQSSSSSAAPEAAEAAVGNQGKFALDMAAASALYGRQFLSLTDFYSTYVDAPQGKIPHPSHLLGLKEDALVILPYDNALRTKQSAIAAHFPRGEVGISLKHHTPHPEPGMQAAMKFQSTHIQLVVGLEGGVATLNNPKQYENGLFGDNKYPMIFLRLKFPEGISEEKARHYMDNIRSWLVILNTYTEFPGDYDGGDPLSCVTKEALAKFAKMLVAALLGDEGARAWLKDPEQRAYCAELAYLALNLGVYFPLNATFLGSDTEKVKAELASKDFLDMHPNEFVDEIDLHNAPETLRPIDEEIAVEPGAGLFWAGLAVKPFCCADMVAEFLRRAVSRKAMGEEKGAVVQGQVLRGARPSFYKLLHLEGDDTKAAFDSLLDRALAIIETPFPSYDEFRAALAPVLKDLSEFSLAHGMAYIPPHAFLLRATDFITEGKREGLFGFTYVGHGVHASLVKGV
jgi:hypothetical protein